MAEVEIKARTLIWEDSESHFESNNHVLKKGEEVVILDPLMRKIGNGSSTYQELKFDTNHNKVSVGSDISTLTLYNVIPQTIYSYRRTNSSVTDVVFLLDSFKDSNRAFHQCDGRMHKIYIENSHTSNFEVEVALTSQESSENSQIIDFGIVTMLPLSYALIEYTWLHNAGGGKVCYAKINLSSVPVEDISFATGYYQNTSGTFTAYNEEKRQHIMIDFNITASSMVVSLNKNVFSTGALPNNKMEHYFLFKNTGSVTKTIVIQGVTSGDILINEGLSAVSLAAGKSLEFSFIWNKKGTTDVCTITKSNVLSDFTV